MGRGLSLQHLAVFSGIEMKKCDTQVVKEIIGLAISGLSSTKIALEIKENLGVEISHQTVRYHRLKKSKQILKGIKEQEESALALEPMMLLENRVHKHTEAIEGEEGKAKPDYKKISDMVDNIARDVHEFERNKQRALERAARNPEVDSTEIEELVITFEKRLQLSRKRQKKKRKIERMAEKLNEDKG